MLFIQDNCNFLWTRSAFKQRWKKVPPEVKERTQPVDLDYAFLDADKIFFQVPENFVLENLQQPVTLESSFASYMTSIIFEHGQLTYTSQLEMRVRALPADQYQRYREFIAAVVKAERESIV